MFTFVFFRMIDVVFMKPGESVFFPEKSTAFRHKMFLIVKTTYYCMFFVETNIQKYSIIFKKLVIQFEIFLFCNIF
jgi:hypothetical protein